MRMPWSWFSPSLVCLIALTGCFEDPSDPGTADAETGTSGDGDGDPGDGDGDPGDGDGDPGDGDGDPGPMCMGAEVECGGTCVVLDNDPANCGECGHDCLGGSCSAGTCEPVPLANNKGRLFMVEVDATHVYYGGDGVNVGRVDKDGTNDTIIAAAGATNNGKEWCYASTKAGNTVVWGNDWVQPGVRGCNLPDCAGGVQTFMAGLNLYAIGYDETNNRLYWSQGDNITSASWPGGAMTSFVAGAPREIANDAAFVYWASRITATDYRIRKRSVGGGNTIELAINRPAALALAVTPTKVLWAETNQIVSAALPNGIGGANPTVFADVGTVRNMIADETHVYWTSNENGVGTVGRCPIAGCDGPPQVLAQVSKPWGIAQDPVAIYVVTEDGEIFKVAK